MVADYLNKELEKEGGKIMRDEESKKYPELHKYLSIPIKESKGERVWKDIDLVAVDAKDNYPIAIISGKTGFHRRLTETLFHSLIFPILTRIKFALVTSDTGRGQKGKWQSELGSEEKRTRERTLFSLSCFSLHNKREDKIRGDSEIYYRFN